MLLITSSNSLYQIVVSIECAPLDLVKSSDNTEIHPILCRWLFNGSDFNGDYNLATNLCGSGYSLMGINSTYEASPNFADFKTYLMSCACGKY
jgi:hypothetical protein